MELLSEILRISLNLQMNFDITLYANIIFQSIPKLGNRGEKLQEKKRKCHDEEKTESSVGA